MSLPAQVSPPQIALSDVAPSAVVGADVVALPVLADPGDGAEAAGPTLGPGAAELLDELDLDLFSLLELHKATGAVGEVVEHAVLSPSGLTNDALRLVLLVGVGGGSPSELRRAGAALVRRAKGHETVATSLAALADDGGLRALVEGLVLGSFEFHWRSTGALKEPVERVVLAGVSDAAGRKAALDRAVAVAGAGWMSRTLALVPSNEKSPEWLADQARTVARNAGLTVKVWDEKQLAAQGFGGILGVGQGSARPPRMVRLDYTPASGARKAKHVVLVGKGITFDTGGLSIKPKDNMMLMKRDMTGAGVVLAVMGALAAVDCPVRVTGLLPLAENSVGANSIRPGDVLVHYGGRTSEVTNTDAEGRLVLADAMAYAVDELAPDALVDIATLTGAMKIALGQKTGGYFATDEALADLLRTASLSADEPLWRMPLVDDYEERLSSKVADADNAAGPPGAITAALFLRHFAGDVPWAHLDIASVGDAPKDEYEYTKGATGFGARALLHWLELREPLAGVGG
ncbi:leucyl aminopeptidase [Nocardioides iriomotensis]|uniref:Probable cytosol aminopeptidase n=1 Tax=Nocardioides iriomotensis TaxID=715784 RepID=A0A4V1Z2E6_9ACTN|nr:leucyl aminopeptidase [Nocardioides iriomotensis]RYU14136.1 leucyl aminopeptidase [Nocardioides iriomotensis]